MGANRLGTGHPCPGALGQSTGDIEHLCAERGDQHLDRGGVGDVEFEMGAEGLTGGIRGLTAHQRQEHVEVLAQVAHRLLPGHAEHVLDHHLMRQADAEGEPTTGDLLHGAGLRRQHHRVSGEGGDHRSAELHVGHLTGGDGQRGECVDTEDLRHPDRGETGLSRGTHISDDGIDSGSLGEQSEFHGDSLQVGGMFRSEVMSGTNDQPSRGSRATAWASSTAGLCGGGT